MRFLSRLILVQDGHIEGLSMMGEVCVVNHDYDSALDCFRKIDRHVPKNKKCELGMAFCLEHNGKLAPAMDMYHQAVMHHGDQVDILLGLARTQMKAKLTEAALANLEKILARDPTNVQALSFKVTTATCRTSCRGFNKEI